MYKRSWTNISIPPVPGIVLASLPVQVDLGEIRTRKFDVLEFSVGRCSFVLDVWCLFVLLLHSQKIRESKVAQNAQLLYYHYELFEAV